VTNQALTLSNDVANDGFSERLDASIGGVTGQATSNDGSFALLAAGASDNASLAVGIDTATAGHKAGTATITLTSNGAGTSDLGTTALGTQTVNVSGDVFRLASASAHTPEPVVFANRHVGDDASQALSLTNTAANDGFSERLNASIGGVTGNATSNNGSFALLNAGATDSSALTVGIDTSSAGHKSGTATISLASDGAGTSGFGGTRARHADRQRQRRCLSAWPAPAPTRRSRSTSATAVSVMIEPGAESDQQCRQRRFLGTPGRQHRRRDRPSHQQWRQLRAARRRCERQQQSLAVGIDTASAGHKTGTATITLASNGAGTSELGIDRARHPDRQRQW
jgi:hypothetical protein